MKTTPRQQLISLQPVMHSPRLELLEDSSRLSFQQTHRLEKAEPGTVLRKEKGKAEEEVAKAEDVDEEEVPQDVAKGKVLAKLLIHQHRTQYHGLLDDEQRTYKNPRNQMQSVSVVE